MPQLGSQFENTYTVEPGKTVSKVVKEKKDPGSGVAQVEKRQAEHQGKPFRNFDYVKEEVETPDTVTDYDVTEYPQGMLFAPETGTFRPGDPLYPREQRLADVKKNYGVSVKGSTPKSRIEEVENAIADTNYSKQELEQGRADVKIETQRGYAGAYNSDINRIYIGAYPEDREMENLTFSHEMGHSFDSKLRITSGPKRKLEQDVMMEKKGRFTISPTEEGVADGMADRYSRVESETPDYYKPNYTNPPTIYENERRLHPSHPDRLRDVKSHGYTTENKLWTNKQEQALYAATRLHVGMHGPKGIAGMPDMNELVHKHLHEEGTRWVQNKRNENEDRYITARRGPDFEDTVPKVHDYDYLKNQTFQKEARALYLGKLLHENPAVHESMHSLGFGEIAKHAVDTYKYHDAVHQQKQTQNQLKLWDEPEPKLTPPKKLTLQQMRRDDYKPKNKDRNDRLDRMFGGWGR